MRQRHALNSKSILNVKLLNKSNNFLMTKLIGNKKNFNIILYQFISKIQIASRIILVNFVEPKKIDRLVEDDLMHIRNTLFAYIKCPIYILYCYLY